MLVIAEPLRLLADATRLRILHLLTQETLTVAELQDLLDLGQSSVSGHLSRLRSAGFIHVLAEGSSHRYRLRDDLPAEAGLAWKAVRDLSLQDATVLDDRRRLAEIRRKRGSTWIERVAGCLHREYAPGRTWETIGHGLLHFARLGRCVDVGAGDGAMAELLVPLCSSLVCVDPSPAMVTAGRARITELGLADVTFLQAGGEDLPLPDASCDSVIFLQSLQFISDPRLALAQAIRVLVPGGRLLVVTLNHHRHLEAERYGHVHFGFRPAQVVEWLGSCADIRWYALPPETRSPRFQSLVITACAPGGRLASGHP